MVSSNDEEFVKLCRSIAWWGRGAGNLNPNGTCGKRFDKWLDNYDEVVDHRYFFSSMGYNLKPLDLQGAIGLVQLGKFDMIEHLRIRNKHHIGSLVEQHIGVCRVITEWNEGQPAWFGVPILVTPPHKHDVQQHFEKNKIQTRNYFAGNILLHPGYSHLGNYNEYPNEKMGLID